VLIHTVIRAHALMSTLHSIPFLCSTDTFIYLYKVRPRTGVGIGTGNHVGISRDGRQERSTKGQGSQYANPKLDCILQWYQRVCMKEAVSDALCIHKHTCKIYILSIHKLTFQSPLTLFQLGKSKLTLLVNSCTCREALLAARMAAISASLL
jgi:hypothetical protein